MTPGKLLALAILLHVNIVLGSNSGLAIWIDRKEVNKLAGVDMNIYVVQDGLVPEYMTLQRIEMLPVLPAEVNIVNMTWQAPNDMYTYDFTILRSLDPLYLFDPLLSIPKAGRIPSHLSVFQVTIPCNGKDNGIGSLYIEMHIYRGRNRPIKGSPLTLMLRKMCKTFAACKLGCMNQGKCVQHTGCVCPKGWTGDRCEIPKCYLPCRNGGECLKPNICQCKGDFYGKQCQLHKDCRTPCKNGGVCNARNKCTCPHGYHGNSCEQATCKKSCNSHGNCLAPNKCKCHPGWFGRYCNKNQLLYYDLFLRRQNKRRLRKKYRHKNKRLDSGRKFRPRRTPFGRKRHRRRKHKKKTKRDRVREDRV